MQRLLIACLWLSLALTAAPAAFAQAPGIQTRPPDVQPTGQPPDQPTPGGPGGPRRPGRPSRAAKEPGRLGLFPLEVVWNQTLAAPPAVWPGYDDTTAYIPIKSGALLAVALRDGVVRWTLDKITVTRPPVVDSGRVYLIGDGTIEARDAATGQPIWHVPAKASVSAQPVARGGWLIVTTEDGDVLALRGETGDVVWEIALGGVVKTEPLIVGDRLYLAPLGSLLMSIDLLTGKTVWERDLGSMVSSIAAHGDRICAGTIGRMFFGLDEARGDIKWRFRIGGDVIGRPGFDDEYAYVITMANEMRAFKLRDGSQRWRTPLEFRPLSGPVRIHDVVLVVGFSPLLRGYDRKDGKRVGQFGLPIGERWAPAAPSQYLAAAAWVDDLIVTPTTDGALIAVRRLTYPPIMMPNPLPGTAAPPPSVPVAPTPATAAAVPATPPSPPRP